MTLPAVIAPVAVETGIVYELEGPDGVIASFNDEDSVDHVGFITAIGGLDGSDVRESTDDLVEADGGVHGSFYLGRRPWTLEGIIDPDGEMDVVNQRVQALRIATRALRADSTLRWTNTGGVPVQLTGRRQVRPIISERRPKKFVVAMVSSDPRIYSQAEHQATVAAEETTGTSGISSPLTSPLVHEILTVNGQLFVDNAGDFTSPPILTVTGPCSDPVIRNHTTGEELRLIYTLAAGETLVIDTRARTILLNGQASRYGALDRPNSRWWFLVPGTNELRVSFAGSSLGAGLTVDWRDAWH